MLKVVFSFFSFVFINFVWCQNIETAIKQAYVFNVYKYSPQTIKSSRIKSIEKQIIDPLNSNKITIDKLTEFNESGKPDFEFFVDINGNQIEYHYTYDAKDRLVMKTKMSPSPKYPYELRAEEIDLWTYTYNQLSSLYNYKMIDNLPDEQGRSYFPEELMLFSCDTFSYLPEDTSVIVFSNNMNYYHGNKINYYHPNFKMPSKTILKFHSNLKIRSKTLERNNQVKFGSYDECGLEITHHQSNNIKFVSSHLLNIGCLPTQFKNYYLHATVDTIVIDGEEKTIFIDTEKEVWIDLEETNYSSDYIKIGPEGYTLSHFFRWISHNSWGANSHERVMVEHYDLSFKLLKTEEVNTFSGAQLRALYQNGISNKSSNTYIIHSTYHYYQNGLLKRIERFNNGGELTKKVFYNVETY